MIEKLHEYWDAELLFYSAIMRYAKILHDNGQPAERNELLNSYQDYRESSETEIFGMERFFKTIRMACGVVPKGSSISALVEDMAQKMADQKERNDRFLEDVKMKYHFT